MRLPIRPRANGDGGPSTTVLVVAIICASAFFLSISAFMYLRSLRRAYSNPRYVPTKFLKSRWRSWTPGSLKYGRIFNKSTSTPLSTVPTQTHNVDTSYTPSVTTNEPTTQSLTQTATTTNNGIDRNTSIRSIMTLPPYRPAPSPSERLIAREGERAGVDMVVEFPETADEEEQRREEDMEALYQVRQARRHEQAERNERRRERQAAREAGDWARLEQLRLESQMRTRARTGSNTSSPFASIINVNAAGIDHTALPGVRDRRVSSVSYASLGLARHDGTRIRADSVESNDQRPLLDSAASMGGSIPGSRRSSLFTTHPQHQRAPSAESVMSVDSDAADTPNTSNRSGSDPPPSILTPSASHGTESSSEMNGEPLGEPPRYEDAADGRRGNEPEEEAPPYTSPVVERGATNIPRLPSIRRIPAIEVTGTTPASSVPATPIEGPQERR